MSEPENALQPQDLALTIFGSHVRGGEMVWSGGMVELLRGFGFSTPAARAALARLVVRDLLARHWHGRLAFYSLTGRADAMMRAGDRRIFTFGRDIDDADWTVVWHAIPENRRVERSRFATQLRFLGFGSIQDATWVAAHDRRTDIERITAKLGIEGCTSVFVGRMSSTLPAGPVIRQAWDLTAVAERHERFLADYERYRKATARRRLSPADAFAVRVLMLHRFRAFPSADPELSGDADGLGRLRARVVTTFDEVYSGLADAAGAYFKEVAQVRDPSDA